MSDDVIPLNEIGIIGTVKVYNQAYVDKQQKRIVELEAQIEKMKCCFSCKHYYSNWCGNPYCKLKGFQIGNRYVCKCNKWEIKEND